MTAFKGSGRVFSSLSEFVGHLEQHQALQRIGVAVDPHLEVTEISRRFLASAGPALLFAHPKNHKIPLLTNLFAHPQRIAWALGLESPSELRAFGAQLAELREPTPPAGIRQLWQNRAIYRRAMGILPKTVSRPPCQEVICGGTEIDLGSFPVMTCWPEDAGPLITWGAVITRNVRSGRENMGIYRLQVIDRHRVIMRWLDHRGGALDYQAWRMEYGDRPFPVAVAIGMDPCSLLAAVMPIPDTLSELNFAGVLRGERTRVTPGVLVDLQLPASAEIVLEGHIYPNDTALEGPFADHTGYYNDAESYPVLTVERLTRRENPIYLSTYTGRPPDEPAILGEALNDIFVPLLQKQFPEIVDFYLPPAACSYRIAVVSIRKAYPGHARRIMLGIWSFLRQFSYTKYLVVTDDDINIRSMDDVLWVIATRTDPARDTLLLDRTPIDILDFASPAEGLGGKMGLNATRKWPAETQRQWGRDVVMTDEVCTQVDEIWESLLASGK